jgi:hypothetical protein
MTYDEVVELLGPQDSEQTGRGLRVLYEDEEVLFGSGKEDVEITKEWRGKARTISVWFSAEGRVIGARYMRFEESILETFRRWVGL